MNHPSADLTAYLDGALSLERAEEVRAHLASCLACREEQARLKSTLAVLASLPPAPEPPPFFANRLEYRIRAEQEQARVGWWPRLQDGLAHAFPRRRVLAVAGGLAAVLVAGVIPVRSWLDTRAMVKDLDLLQDYETARAVGVDSLDDVQIVAQLDELEHTEVRP